MIQDNRENRKQDFERVAKRWNDLAEEERTPEKFLDFFTNPANGNFDNAEEVQELSGDIFALFEKQTFPAREKADIKKALTDYANPILRQSFAPYSVDQFIKDVKEYDPAKDFSPENMKDVSFQEGTFNIIAARPSRGKTTFLINLALEAAKKAASDKTSKRVLFLTLEETQKQIYTRLVNSLIFCKAKKTGNIAQIQTRTPRRTLYGAIKDPKNPDYEDKEYYIQNALNELRELEKEAIKIIDMGSANTINAIENYLILHPDAIVFIDYVTLIRADPSANSTRYEYFTDISMRLVESAKKNNQIIIAAAQMRRTNDAGDSDAPDQFNDTLLKESGQFEQDANTVIAIGRSTNYDSEKTRAQADKSEPAYFWKIVKNRNGGGVNNSYLFDARDNSMGFSFLQSTTENAHFLNYPPKARKEKETKQKETRDPKTGRRIIQPGEELPPII